MTKPYTDEMWIARFWEQVDKRGSCWLWIGPMNHKGYGAFAARLGGQKYWRSHRFSWALHNGQNPGNDMVIHSCDNRWCVNPDHLTVGTALQNEHDKIQKGRNTRGEVVNGAKLTPDIVRLIRRGGRSDGAWAKKYGVHPTTIRNARIGKKWAHIE